VRRAPQLRGEGGQATLEFALVLPLLLMVVTAIVQLGLVLHDSLDLTDAVRTGARVATLSRGAPSPSAAAESAVRSAAGGLRSADLAVSVVSTWQAGTDVQVTATYPYTLSIFGIPVHTGSLRSSTTERVE
jgi:Flp pilus assembly protein TadG